MSGPDGEIPLPVAPLPDSEEEDGGPAEPNPFHSALPDTGPRVPTGESPHATLGRLSRWGARKERKAADRRAGVARARAGEEDALAQQVAAQGRVAAARRANETAAIQDAADAQVAQHKGEAAVLEAARGTTIARQDLEVFGGDSEEVLGGMRRRQGSAASAREVRAAAVETQNFPQQLEELETVANGRGLFVERTDRGIRIGGDRKKRPSAFLELSIEGEKPGWNIAISPDILAKLPNVRPADQLLQRLNVLSEAGFLYYEAERRPDQRGTDPTYRIGLQPRRERRLAPGERRFGILKTVVVGGRGEPIMVLHTKDNQPTTWSVGHED